jgi:hypothetical protein
MKRTVTASVSAVAVTAVMALSTAPALANAAPATATATATGATHGTAVIDGTGVITFNGGDIADFISEDARRFVASRPAGNSCSNTNCSCRPR